MTASARDRARTLELIIRAAVAEERLLGARLARMAEDQRRTRDEIARELRREHFGQSANGNGAAVPAEGASPPADGANGAAPSASGASRPRPW